MPLPLCACYVNVSGLDARAVLDHLSPNGAKGQELSGIDLEAFHQVRERRRMYSIEWSPECRSGFGNRLGMGGMNAES